MLVGNTIKIAALQYITPYNYTTLELSVLVEKVCRKGIDWIQLRLKNKPYQLIKESAVELRKICNKYSTKLIINDYVQIAKETAADGVHLGKEDISPLEARKILGDNSIIGGTANTLEDIKQLNKLGVDYIGLGPFQFTHTKKGLSPILGLKGINEIIKQCKAINIDIPIVAVGGITIEDISPLLNTGIHGVAVSSAINQSSNIQLTATKFNDKIKKSQKV